MPKKFLNQKGIAPLLIMIIITIIAGGVLYFQSKKIELGTNSSTSESRTMPSSSPKPTSIVSLTPKATVKVAATTKPTSSPKTAASLTPSPSPTASSSSSSSSSSTATPQPTPTPTPAVTCQINVDKSSGSAPLTVTYVYGASYQQSDGYVTNVQWDFNGDGSWDTPYDTSEQHPPPYTFSSAGTYNSKMHLQTQGGRESDVCTKTIVVS